MDLLSAVLLGLVQGFTEWLPISSTGHLVMAQALLGISVQPEFDIAVMIGTTAALLIYFRKKILEITLGALAQEKKQLNYLLMIVIAGIPTAIIGFLGRGLFKSLFLSSHIVGFFIILTGAFLLLAARAKPKSPAIKPAHSFLVGIAQGIAIAPGISRSGSTIGTAMLLGIPAVEAAEFSFIIGIPAMTVASLLEFREAGAAGLELSITGTGIIAAFIAGYLSIGFFMGLLKEKKFHWFGYYCLAVGALFMLLISIK